jgi:putative SOS response-associated peptidase YedK
MCGRFALITPAGQIAEIFAVDGLPDLVPRYNIAPTSPVSGIVLRDGARRHETFRWGLIPTWAKDRKIGARMINARGETVHAKPAFRDAFRQRRALIVADGFYEWTRQGRAKLPHLIQVDSGRPFALAGLWSFWRDPVTQEAIQSCTVLTTTPNALMAPIHDRMPVILDRASWDLWLGPDSDAATLKTLIQPFDPSRMTTRRVHQTVNSVRNEGPTLHAPFTGDGS